MEKHVISCNEFEARIVLVIFYSHAETYSLHYVQAVDELEDGHGHCLPHRTDRTRARMGMLREMDENDLEDHTRWGDEAVSCCR